ncbi:MAG: hypothetical protein ACEQSX_11185 [Baekduiaceae bacterium]
MTLPEKLVAIHRALDAAALPHAFGGAIALAYATLDPRGTSDIDVNVFADAADAARVLGALPPDIGGPPDVVAALVRDGQARLWWDETPVDLFLDTVPLHADAAAHRREVPFAGTTIPVLGPVELAVFKATFDRTKDWADSEAMLAARTLDPEEGRIALADLLPHGDQRFARLAAAAREAERSHE